MTKTHTKLPTPDELLVTNSLSHKEIILRLDYIRDLLSKGELEFDEKQLIKLEKLIEKSRYNELDEDYDRSKEIPSQIEYPKDEEIYRTTGFLSEKYLTKKEIASTNLKIKKAIFSKYPNLELRPYRETIRTSENAEDLKKIVISKTKIKKYSSEEDFFKLKYPVTDSDDKSITDFKLKIKITDNKFKIMFYRTFKENDPLKMKPEDYLFPEEIQMAMFEKLISQYPEILKKLTTARKIDCVQVAVVNENSLARISKYLDHIKDNPEDRVEIKSILDSSPNQSNTQNFMNQLKLKFNLQIDALPPKTLVNRLISAVNLKQTFSKKRCQD